MPQDDKYNNIVDEDEYSLELDNNMEYGYEEECDLKLRNRSILDSLYNHDDIIIQEAIECNTPDWNMEVSVRCATVI
jgi:hypothetical protein